MVKCWNDEIVKWWNGEVVKWWSGEVVKWSGAMVKWWNRKHRENRSTWRKTCSTVTLSKTGLTWTGLRLNPSLSCLKIEINLKYIKRFSSYRAVNTLHLSETKRCRKTVAVCPEIPAEHVNTVCGQNLEFLNAIAGAWKWFMHISKHLEKTNYGLRYCAPDLFMLLFYVFRHTRSFVVNNIWDKQHISPFIYVCMYL